MSLREQFREIAAVLWEVIKRCPLLLSPPVTFYLRFFEKDTLYSYFEQAEQVVRQRREQASTRHP